jgi:hypothetical protein
VFVSEGRALLAVHPGGWTHRSQNVTLIAGVADSALRVDLYRGGTFAVRIVHLPSGLAGYSGPHFPTETEARNAAVADLKRKLEDNHPRTSA